MQILEQLQLQVFNPFYNLISFCWFCLFYQRQQIIKWRILLVIGLHFSLNSMPSFLETWQNFFQSCDIPANMGKKYANIFVAQRMKPDMLKDLGLKKSHNNLSIIIRL